jgi:hypothetical protein
MARALEALDQILGRLEKGEISAIEAIDELLAEELRGGLGFSTGFMPRSALAWVSYHAASFMFGLRLS